MWSLVYPGCVAVFARRKLEYPLRIREWSVLLLSQLNSDVCSGRSSCSIVAGTKGSIFGHGGVYHKQNCQWQCQKGFRHLQLTLVDSWFFGLPLHVAARVDTVVEIAEGKDAAVLSVPWPTEIALTGYVE